MEVLVRELCNIRNSGKDVVLVSSGAISVGKKSVHLENDKSGKVSVKQACAAIGQAKLMMIYQKFFAEYNQVTAQVLMTKDTITNTVNRVNAHNTFSELLELGVIPVVNENDTISTYEIKFGDNDTLSAIVAALIDADLLILYPISMVCIPIIREVIRMRNLLRLWKNSPTILCIWVKAKPAVMWVPEA
jgi:glutamate 5-kinase